MSRPSLLVSVRCADEVASAVSGGAEIIDVKDPSQGSLGMASPETVAACSAAVPDCFIWTLAGGELLETDIYRVRKQWPNVTLYEDSESEGEVCLCDLSNATSDVVLDWVNKHGLLDACLTDKGCQLQHLTEKECYDGEDAFEQYTFQGVTHTALMPEGQTRYRWESFSEADMSFTTIGPYSVVVFDEDAIPEDIKDEAADLR